MTIMNNFLSDNGSFYSFVLPMLWDTNQDQDPAVLISVQAPDRRMISAAKRSDKLNEQCRQGIHM